MVQNTNRHIQAIGYNITIELYANKRKPRLREAGFSVFLYVYFMFGASVLVFRDRLSPLSLFESYTHIILIANTFYRGRNAIVDKQIRYADLRKTSYTPLTLKILDTFFIHFCRHNINSRINTSKSALHRLALSRYHCLTAPL